MKYEKKYLKAVMILKFISILLFFTGFLSAETGLSESSTMLWEISKENKRLYILGSIHTGDSSLYPLNQKILDAFQESEHLAVEVNISSPNVSKIQQIMKQRGYYPNHEKIKDHISEEVYSTIATKLQEINLDISYFEKLRPWLLALTLSGLLEKEKRYSPAFGIDNYFLKEAGHRQIHEMESAQYQLELFSNAPMNLQYGFLYESIQDKSFIKTNMGQAVEAWKNGDAETMEKTFLSPYYYNPLFDPILKFLFYERNIGMVEKIEGYLEQEGTFFVVVGVGHVIGPNGIIDLLERKKIFQIRKI
jgi:uncharacterized protein